MRPVHANRGKPPRTTHAHRALLDRACRDDPDLRHRFDALLFAHDRPSPAFDRPLAATPDPATQGYTPTGPATPSESGATIAAVRQSDPGRPAKLVRGDLDWIVMKSLDKDRNRLAAVNLAREKPGQTFDATALVHEAYLRLVGPADGPRWAGRGHFPAAAAEAMRRVLVDVARRTLAAKRGGGGRRFEVSEADRVVVPDPDTLLAVDEALAGLAAEDEGSAGVARLRLFAGASVEEAAAALGVSRATAFRDWAYARAWLTAALGGG